MELVDNSIDAALRKVRASGRDVGSKDSLAKYGVNLDLSDDRIELWDNCGGMSIEAATTRAFGLGRIRGASDSDTGGDIGVYGIGMKRAAFKLGRLSTIESRTSDNNYVVTIDTDLWTKNDKWEFPIEVDADVQLDTYGLRITITDLNEGVSQEVSDPSFVSGLIQRMGQTYGIFLGRGFSIRVNESVVAPDLPMVRTSENFEPVIVSYQDEADTDVDIEIRVGIGSMPNSTEEVVDNSKSRQYSGWYVSCNDRFVLIADKSEKTVWGDKFPAYHSQYNGFVGIIDFSSSYLEKLPWTTDKQDVDLDNDIYRRNRSTMKELTRQFINYTNMRKFNIEEAKQLESGRSEPTELVYIEAKPVARRTLKLPKISASRTIRIQYDKDAKLIKKVGQALGLGKSAAAKHVGEKCFDYVVEAEGIDTD